MTGLRCRRARLGAFDASGRRRPETGADESFVVEADQIVVAIGQRLPGDGTLGGLGVTLNARGFIQADSLTGQTSVPWLFAGGDAVLGPASVVQAIAGGERAAVAIDALLTGSPHAFWRRDHAPDTVFDPDADPVMRSRARPRLVPVERRKHNFNEVELPLGEGLALGEAKRCLRCDYRAEGQAEMRGETCRSSS